MFHRLCSFPLAARIAVVSLSSVAFLGAQPPAPHPARISPEKRDLPPIDQLRRGHGRPPLHLTFDATTRQPGGLAPAAVAHAYGFDAIKGNLHGKGQTIAIVDAYDDPNIEADLGVFSAMFSLPPCTTANGCFRKVYASGAKPAADAGWSTEISLDVEWAHAIAPQAAILLVEAKSSMLTELLAAVDVAVRGGASVVSMSFGATEFSGDTYFDAHFNVANVSFLASAGDSGAGVEYPAACANVTGVGGSTLTLKNGVYAGETAWAGSGGGVSATELLPAYQSGFNAKSKRGVPDVAYNADPNSGIPIYDSLPYQGYSGWFLAGGTSAGAPQWAGLFALANAMRAAAHKLPLSMVNYDLYRSAVSAAAYGANYNDITAGKNGTCATCSAAKGYDFVTGLGSPKANNLLPALVALP